MSKAERIGWLEGIIYDLLDGQYGAHEIQRNTGCDLERCKEIETAFKEIRAKQFDAAIRAAREG